MMHDFMSMAMPLISLPRPVKRIIVLMVDICLCVLSTWLAFFLRLNEFVQFNMDLALPIGLAIAIALPIFSAMGLYRAISRYSGWPTMVAVSGALALYSLFYSTVVMIIGLEGTPRTIGVIQPLLLLVGVAGSRILASFWLSGLQTTQRKQNKNSCVVIYGAGAAGRQVSVALSGGHEMFVVAFIDDNEALHGRTLNGVPIFGPRSLSSLVISKKVTHLLLAIPSLSRSRRKSILRYLEEHKVSVTTLPSLRELAEGRVTLSDIKDPDIEDLLDRDFVAPNVDLLAKKVTSKTVLVTGAGGSIGSELCRQIIELKPKVLLLFEINEFSLYSLHSELELINDGLDAKDRIRVIPLLGSVQDRERVEKIMFTWRPDTVYHSAAYKHVPLVEYNLVEGVKNNVLGTLTLVRAAIAAGVSDYVLVSSDKAVRPTNVMGATKRLAEMTLQALHAKRRSNTRLSMVRFGNVLASSGSVIPKFLSQIREGRKVTVTHPDVTRFFMTITEAAQLVIQASALADGGDVFVLEMGEPVRIMDLARRMIKLSGLSEKTDTNPDGDVVIEITGLRPGEKLCEELLIGDKFESTSHPKITKAHEYFLPWEELLPELDSIAFSAHTNDAQAVFLKLAQLVEGLAPDREVSDLVFVEERNDSMQR